MTESRERAYYRIRYPRQVRPRLAMSESMVPVIEIAEYGLRFETGGHQRPEVGDEVSGTLHLGDRWTLDIAGEVVWTLTDSAAIKLFEPIPFKVILDEQLYLRSRFAGR